MSAKIIILGRGINTFSLRHRFYAFQSFPPIHRRRINSREDFPCPHSIPCLTRWANKKPVHHEHYQPKDATTEIEYVCFLFSCHNSFYSFHSQPTKGWITCYLISTLFTLKHENLAFRRDVRLASDYFLRVTWFKITRWWVFFSSTQLRKNDVSGKFH